MNIAEYLGIVLGSVIRGLGIMLEGFETPQDYILALPTALSQAIGLMLG